MDTLVYRYKTLLMQRLIDWVSRGYCWYAEGTVKASRAYALCEKFDALYFTGAVRNQRFYRKQKPRRAPESDGETLAPYAAARNPFPQENPQEAEPAAQPPVGAAGPNSWSWSSASSGTAPGSSAR